MADLTVGASSASTEIATETSEPVETPMVDDAASDSSPKDTSETASDEAEIPTKDTKSFIGSFTDSAKKASKAAWQYTAEAQKKVNEEAKKPRDFSEKVGEKAGIDPREMREARASAGGDEFWEDAAETSGGSRHAMKASRDLYDATGWESAQTHDDLRAADHAAHVVHKAHEAVHSADVLQSTARNASKILKTGGPGWYKAGKRIVEHGQLTHTGKLGTGMKAVGVAGFAYTAGNGLAQISQHGLRVDSLEPAADIGASAIGTFGGPVGTAFSIGYEVGGWIDDKANLSGKYADAMLEEDIQRTTQIGFLADRADDMDLAAGYRTQSGTWTAGDEYRMRSIVREAREHGLVSDDGNVSWKGVYGRMPKGTTPETIDRVVGGIERALDLEKAVAGRGSAAG
jgi:hypothetical protein